MAGNIAWPVARLALLWAPLFSASSTFAHTASTAYLVLKETGSHIDVQLSLPLRDLDYILGLDTNGDGTITWGEVRTQ